MLYRRLVCCLFDKLVDVRSITSCLHWLFVVQVGWRKAHGVLRRQVHPPIGSRTGRYRRQQRQLQRLGTGEPGISESRRGENSHVQLCQRQIYAAGRSSGKERTYTGQFFENRRSKNWSCASVSIRQGWPIVLLQYIVTLCTAVVFRGFTQHQLKLCLSILSMKFKLTRFVWHSMFHLVPVF